MVANPLYPEIKSIAYNPKKTYLKGWPVDESAMSKMVDETESSHHKIFKDLPELHEQCRTKEEARLHLVRAALRLRERYSHIPFYKQRAERAGSYYWLGLAMSEVNA